MKRTTRFAISFITTLVLMSSCVPANAKDRIDIDTSQSYTGMWYSETAGTEPELSVVSYEDSTVLVHWVSKLHGTLRGYGYIDPKDGRVKLTLYSDTSDEEWGGASLSFDPLGQLHLDAKSQDGAEVRWVMSRLIDDNVTCGEQ